ncbi:MAG TPA: hypothetical protein VHH88_02185 [Verrucomicrobiae bacterium]|nr:hypothetical protein [Verrucomicrobiae bacterium]
MQDQPGKGIAEPVAAGNAHGADSQPAAGPGAKESVPLFGGRRGGRAREDGLVPGSPEAVAADRKKDRERKRSERAALPDPLPAKLALPSNPMQTPGAVVDPVPVAAPEPDTFVPWDSETLRPVLSELVATIEEMDAAHVTELANQAALPKELVREIAKDARYPTAAKKGIEIGGAEMGAKYLNKAGISAKNKGEVVFATALVSIIASRRSLNKRLEKLIEQRNKEQGKQPSGPPAPAPALNAGTPRKP